MTITDSILDEKMEKYILSLYGVRCKQCNEKIKIGDRMIIKYGGKGKTRHYHFICWTRLHH